MNEGEKSLQPTKGSNRLWIAWALFVLFALLFSVSNEVFGDSANQSAWLLMDVFVIIIDIIILIKHRFPTKKSILISFILCMAVMLSYLDVMIASKSVSGIASLLSSTTLTFMSGLAVFSIFEKYREGALPLIKNKSQRNILISIILGIVFGIVWGAINYMLISGNQEGSFNLSIHCLLVALSPAILEELAMRTVFYALCIGLLKGKPKTKSESFTCYFMMIVPHVLIHTSDAYRSGVVNGIISTLLYIVIFGLIFAILQRKRDIASAMIAHGTVDFIRFCFFGLPF